MAIHKEIIPQHTVLVPAAEKISMLCDVCNKHIDCSDNHLHRCELCNKMLCKDHRIVRNGDLTNHTSDYFFSCCPDCIELYTSCQRDMGELDIKFERVQSKILAKYKKLAVGKE